MQQIEYQASPYLIFGYMQFLIAYNTAKWDGYVREPNAYPGYTGDAFYYDTFLQLHPFDRGGVARRGADDLGLPCGRSRRGCGRRRGRCGPPSSPRT